MGKARRLTRQEESLTEEQRGKKEHGRENGDSSVKKIHAWSFPGGAVVKNPPANAGDTGSSPGPGRSHMPRNN